MIEPGQHVRLFLPMANAHGLTGVITQIHVADDAGQPITCRVQIDGTEDSVIVHRSSIRPISKVLEWA